MNIKAKELLQKQYPFKIEMHAHSSPCSHCSEVAPERVVELYKEKGYDAIVLTNHFHDVFIKDKQQAIAAQIDDYNRAVEAGKKFGLQVLLGTEVKFQENGNDYLVYGVDEEILSVLFDYFPKGLEAFRKEVSLPNSVFLQAHPFRPHCVRMDAELLDGIEVFNLHPHHNSNAQAAMEYAAMHPEFILSAGSDFHHEQPGHCGSTALLSSTLPTDSFAVATILKSGDYLFRLHDSIFTP